MNIHKKTQPVIIHLNKNCQLSLPTKSTEVLQKNKRSFSFQLITKPGRRCATTSKPSGIILKVQLTSQGEQEGHPTAGDPFHLTSLYIIPLIKTTACQLGFNKSSVNYTEALMSNNRNKTAISEAYSSDLME